MRKKTMVIHCDFETTTQNINAERTDVWLWGSLDSNDKFSFDISIGSFFDYVDSWKENCIIYFHNGSRFDFEFIKHYIGENLTFVNSSKDLVLQSAWVMARDASMSYSIHYKNAKGRMIYFKCSYLFLKTALEKLPGSSKIKKDDSFYEKERNYKNKSEVNKEDVEYLYHDLLTQKNAMDTYSNINNVKIRSYTSTGVAFTNFKKTVVDFKKKYENQIDLMEHDVLSKWATGAMNQLKEEQQLKKLLMVSTYDVNSLYPYIMTNTWMPYGKPIYQCNSECNHKFSLFELRITGKIKKGYIPCLTTTNFFSSMVSIDWKSELKDDNIFITKSMWQEVSQYYNWSQVEVINVICFETTFGVGHDFIEKEMIGKAAAPNPSIERENHKLNMNGCYGRFMMSPRIDKYTMELIGDKQLKHYEMAYGKYYMKKTEEISEKIMYNPMGIAILSNAREYLIKHIQMNRENFVYTDTDSITIIGNDFKGFVHPTKLGAWKYEGTYEYGYYIKRKMYVKANIDENIVEAKGAGINADLTFKGKTIQDVINKNIIPVSKGMVKVNGGKYMRTIEKKVKGWID